MRRKEYAILNSYKLGVSPDIIGIRINRDININTTRQKMASFDQDIPYVTRHFNSSYYESVRSGEIRFGTIYKYRKQEEVFAHRFCDDAEGTQSSAFYSSDGTLSGRIHTTHFKDNIFHGLQQHVVVEYYANEYCLCASNDVFSRTRAERFREGGNSDINAYAVYDLRKLKHIILNELNMHIHKENICMISRKICYKEKNSLTTVLGHVNSWGKDVELKAWNDVLFTKPSRYRHEDEVRIILTDVSRIGNLYVGSDYLSIADKRIADTIVDMGEF